MEEINDPISKAIVRIISDTLGINGESVQNRFGDIGIDSLSIVSLRSAFQVEFGVPITDLIVNSSSTISSITESLHQLLNSQQILSTTLKSTFVSIIKDSGVGAVDLDVVCFTMMGGIDSDFDKLSDSLTDM